jgi:hypothetical protein
MKCAAAETWLLAAEAADGLPGAVRHHLDRCPRCRRQRERIDRLERLLAGQAPPAFPAAARDRLWRELERLPARSAAAPRERKRWPRPWIAALVLLSAGLGWLLASRDGSAPADRDVAPPAALPRNEELLVARFLERDLRLTRTSSPGEQLQVLRDMADDLRGEALHRARQGAAADVPLVTGLYGRVVREGLVGRALALPAEQRPAQVAAVLRQLHEAETEADRAAVDVPAPAGVFLKPIGEASRDAQGSLRDGRLPVPGPGVEVALAADDAGTWRALLTVLVVQGLRLAEEEDPARRADYSRELAELEELLRRAGRVANDLERARSSRLHGPGPLHGLPASEAERLKELEKTVKELEEALKRMKKAGSKGKEKGPKGKDKDKPDKAGPKGKEKGPKGKGKDKENEHEGKGREQGDH